MNFGSIVTFRITGVLLIFLNCFEAIVPAETSGIRKRPEVVTKCTSSSKAVAACIHTYLEKDFLSISRIVYPKIEKEGEECVNSEEYERKHHIMMDGPALDNSCNDLKHVINCLTQELNICDSLGPYFELRHLIYSLKKVMTWLCGRVVTIDSESEPSDKNPHTVMRSRFLVLLESIKCLECVRMSSKTKDCVPCPAMQDITTDVALWNKILRLEVSWEVCPELRVHVACLQNGEMLSQACGSRASEIYRNLTNLFLEAWCDQAPFVKSQAGIDLRVTTSQFIFVYLVFIKLVNNLVA